MRRFAKAEAEALIKPNKVLTSFERLEIYNRQYWFRVLSCFAEDFPGLRAIVGTRVFEKLMRAYLRDCPSRSFTLRNLGSRLEEWLRPTRNGRPLTRVLRWIWCGSNGLISRHLTAVSSRFITPTEIESAGLELRISLQPYVRLLELAYPVDDLLIEVHDYEGETDVSSNAARQSQLRTRVRHYSQPEPEPVYLAVHRADDSVYYKRLANRVVSDAEGSERTGTAVRKRSKRRLKTARCRTKIVCPLFRNGLRIGRNWDGSRDPPKYELPRPRSLCPRSIRQDGLLAAVAISAGGAVVLGVAVRSNRMGQVAAPSESNWVLYESRHPGARICALFRSPGLNSLAVFVSRWDSARDYSAFCSQSTCWWHIGPQAGRRYFRFFPILGNFMPMTRTRFFCFPPGPDFRSR